jgi:hypothetical protein
LDNEALQSAAMRWNLRGLPADMAIHKIKVDQEINNNVRSNKPKTEKWTSSPTSTMKPLPLTRKGRGFHKTKAVSFLALSQIR